MQTRLLFAFARQNLAEVVVNRDVVVDDEDSMIRLVAVRRCHAAVLSWAAADRACASPRFDGGKGDEF